VAERLRVFRHVGFFRSWQQETFGIDPAFELPDRQAIIEDLADFAEALQPSLDDMKADRWCRLIEKYAAWESRQSDLSLSHTASLHRSGELVRGRGPVRVEASYRDDQVALM
jgi:hypothetical protein